MKKLTIATASLFFLFFSLSTVTARPKCPPGAKCGLKFCNGEWKKWEQAKVAYNKVSPNNPKGLMKVRKMLMGIGEKCLTNKQKGEKLHMRAYVALHIGRSWARLKNRCDAGLDPLVINCITSKAMDQASALSWYAEAQMQAFAMKQKKKFRPVVRRAAGSKLVWEINLSIKRLQLKQKCQKMKRNCLYSKGSNNCKKEYKKICYSKM